MAAPMGPPAPRPVGNGGGGGGVPARPQLKAQLSLASGQIADTLAKHHGHLYRGGNPFARRLIQIADLQRTGRISAAQKAALKKRLLGLSFAGRDDVARLEKEMDDHIHQALGATALDASVRGAQLSKMSAMSMVSSDGRSGAAPFAPVLRQASSDRVGGESYSCMYNCGFVGTYDVVNHHEEAALCFGPDDDL